MVSRGASMPRRWKWRVPQAMSRWMVQGAGPGCSLTAIVALEGLGLEESPAGRQHVLDVPVHHRRQVVAGETDAVVGQPVLRKVVGADLLGSLAGADHALARSRPLLLLALLFHVVEAAA